MARRSSTRIGVQESRSPAVVEAEGIYANLLRPELPTFQIERTLDWVHPIMVRRVVLVQADFLLFDPIRDANRLRALLAEPVPNEPSTELDVFSAWLTQASGEEGLQAVSEGDLRLLRVIDHRSEERRVGNEG